MIKKRKITLLFLAISLCFSCFLTCFAPTTKQNVYASSIGVIGGYTNVLDDLQKDTNFNADYYPVIENDYSLKVIQIAESNEQDLFVYVYQPCSPNEDLKATSINISMTIGAYLSYKNYSLMFINQQGCFVKYKDRKSVV